MWLQPSVRLTATWQPVHGVVLTSTHSSSLTCPFPRVSGAREAAAEEEDAEWQVLVV